MKVRVNPATQRIQLNNAKMELNPFCEIALEQAIRLKEMKFANEVDYYKAIVCRLLQYRLNESNSGTTPVLYGFRCRSEFG